MYNVYIIFMYVYKTRIIVILRLAKILLKQFLNIIECIFYYYFNILTILICKANMKNYK